MDYKSYISGITFSFIQPSDSGVGLLTNMGIPSTVDIRNTNLPHNNIETKERLKEICEVPRMSTYAIGAIINLIVSKMAPDTAFVNIGVWYGFTFLCGLVDNGDKKCIGIDDFSEFDKPRHEFFERFHNYKNKNHFFYEMDYMEYFSKMHKDPIGFYIYDGNHSKEHQFKGLQVAEPFFSKGCLILIDDINWSEVTEGTEEFIKQSDHTYEVIAEERTIHNFHPTFWNGITLLRMIE